MDNFYIRFTGFSEYEKENNNSNVIDYKYETLHYNEDNILRLRNKHTSNEREIGTINSKILLISKSEEETNTVIVTQEDILLFDCYFDLIGSLELDIKDTFLGIEWGEEEFVVVCRDKLLFFDIKMNLIGENTSYEFVCVSYRKKYNLFVCATKDKIVFIESNGLEHGDHLNIVTSYLKLLNDDLLLCATISKINNEIETTVELFYSKNFHWYKKQKKTCEGKFLGVRRNSLFIQQSSKTLEYTILNRVDACNNRFYVVDGSNILYTNMNRSKVPPPMFDFIIDCKQNIANIDIQENNIYIFATNKLLNFDKSFNLKSVHECGKNDFPKEINFTASYKDVIYIFFNDKISLYTDNKNKEIDLECLINYIWIKKKIYHFNDEFTCEKYSFWKLNVVDMKIFDQLPCLFLNNGSIIVEGIVFDVEYDFTYSKLDVKKIGNDVIIGFIKNKNLLLIKIAKYNSKNKLFDHIKQYSLCATKKPTPIINNESHQYRTVLIDDYKIESLSLNNVESFLLNSHSFVFIQNKSMNILVNGTHQLMYSDPEFKILGCTDLEIFGETRHGTFETFYPKSYSDIFVQKLIEKQDYKRAFEMSNSNYTIFMNNYLDIETLSKCPSKLLISFILEVSKQFGDYRIILDNEKIEKYRNEFDDELYLETFKVNNKLKEKYVKLSHPTLCKLLDINPDDSYETKPILLSECFKNYTLKTLFLNILLGVLDPIRQFEIILFLFIKFKRTDLAIKISQCDLNKGIKYLMTLTTTEDIKRSAILSFDKGLITEAYRIIQQDTSDIMNYIEIGGNVKYRLSNLIEDRKNGLNHLICELSHNSHDTTLLDNLRQYVKKYVLGRELLICSCCEEFENIRNLLLELFADTTTNDKKAIKVYKHLDKNEKLVNLYVEKNMFREAIEEYRGDKRDLYPIIKKNLERTGLFYDLGVFCEEFEKNIILAIKNYLKSKRLSEVLRLIKMFNKQERDFHKQTILTECSYMTKNQIIALNEIFKRYEKYRDRLKTIDNRTNDYVNDDTSFSFSVTSEKSRGRPGGIYEKEFVLEKLANLGIKIYKWREDIEELIEIFQIYESEIHLQDLISRFELVRDVLRSEFYELFKDDDYISYDNTKKRVTAPDLTKYI